MAISTEPIGGIPRPAQLRREIADIAGGRIEQGDFEALPPALSA
jgi:hypothetical protein